MEDNLVAVMVFTRDLRVRDNPALAAAMESGPVVPLFVLDERILSSPFASPNRLGFLIDALRDLDTSLRDRNGRLVVRRGRWVEEVVGAVRDVGATTIHIADDVSAFARGRVDALLAATAGIGVEVRRHPGVTVVPPQDVTPATSDLYQVFTPYYRAWLAAPWRSVVATPRSVDVPGSASGIEVPALHDLVSGVRSPDFVAGGEGPARTRLHAWVRRGLASYADRHDDLPGVRHHTSAHTCTSGASPRSRWQRK